ncbi:tail assembly chaperone [Fructilactobacillus frigidiflavus]|uniref:tail assembly chaperone n=1 Tax=Fructilactobacillus frigidiflavus TaxID=3242688 RepID=UPI0037564A84
MELTINGKKYNFKFGIKFVRTLNDIAGATMQGMKFGMALSTTCQVCNLIIHQLYRRSFCSKCNGKATLN